MVEFRLLQWRVGHGLLEFEVHDRHGRRPMRLRFDPDWLSLDHGKLGPLPVPFGVDKWHHIRLHLDCDAQSYDLAVDGGWVRRSIPFAEPVDSLERLVFRTGPWRSDVRLSILDGEPANTGLDTQDLPGADHQIPLSVFYIDDVKTAEYKGDV